MKVTISVFSRFHAFYLADQLERRGHLERLITSYPRFEVKKYGIPPDRIVSLPMHELVSRGWNGLPARLKQNWDPDFLLHEMFDRAACRHISTNADIYVGWSGFSERGLRLAQSNGAVTIIERGSAHIEVQRALLREEYEQWGLQPQLPHPKIVEKEIREYDLADYISVPSTFAKRSFLAKGFPESKLLSIPYGTDLPAFHPSAKDDNRFRVVCAGTLSLRKGVHYLLRAFAELALPGAELWLIGTLKPEIVPFLHQYEGSFRYIGHVPQAQLGDYYAQASVFVLCSIEEGMAMVLLQAMGASLPIICTPNTGGEDLVVDGQEGFVIPIRDVDALKERLLDLHQDEELRLKMAQAALQRVRAAFTWDDYGDRIATAYADVLDGRQETRKILP
jgi:glycosyltransferase involved in cell wall biosynthesis